MTFRGRESTSVGLTRRLVEPLAIRELRPTVLARSVETAIARP